MIKKWILKAVVQKTISFLPYRNNINYLFQKHVTKGVDLTSEYFEDRLSHAKNHISWYQEKIGSLNGKNTFELGCGWYPVVPISMFLNGVESIHSIDISLLMTKESLRTTLEMFKSYHENNTLNKFYIPKKERIAILFNLLEQYDNLSMKEILKQLHFVYFVEDLITLNKIPTNSIDLIHSNNTLEHIYPNILKAILSKLMSLSKKQEGIQSHFIDMSDHFAHFDHSITIYNFLRFTSKQWSFIDNKIQPQNRYRMSDYKKTYQELNIPLTHITQRNGDLSSLAIIKINKELAHYKTEDLAVSHCHIYSLSF